MTEMGARRFPLDLEVACLIGFECVRDDLAGLGVEVDVVAVRVDLAICVAADIDCDGVVMVGTERIGRHRLGAGHGYVEGDVLAAGVLVDEYQDSTDDDEDRNDSDDNGYAIASHDFLLTEMGARTRPRS